MTVDMIDRRRLALLLVVFCALAGCTAMRTPDDPPRVALPSNFGTENGADWPDELSAGWWRVVGQPGFGDLADRALAENYGLREAAARLDAAQAARRAVGDSFRPQTTLSPRLRWERTETRVRDPSSGIEGRATQRTTLGSTGAEASWEIDLLGRAAMQARAADADVSSTQADVAAARLSVTTELLRSYAQLGLAETEDRLLGRNLEARRRVLELVRQRAVGGIASEFDVARAETELRRIEARIPALAAERSAQRAAIGALLGEPYPFAGPAPFLDLSRFRFASVPADVLRRRPDVRAAATAIIRAAAERDLSEADLYPRLTLSGDLVLGRGLSGDVVSSITGAFGLSLQIPLFDRDLRRARLAAREASLEATAFAYRDRVVTGAGEVWRGLSALREARRQIAAARAALDTARRADTLSEQLFRGGTISLTDRLTASTAALDAEIESLTSRRQEVDAVVAILKATAP